MNVYPLKDFARQARKHRLSEDELCKAVARAEKGLNDGQIGKFLIKQRIGLSGSFRTIIVYRQGDMAVFVHMFPKNAQANLTPNEEITYRGAAKEIADLGDEHIKALIDAGEWIEIDYEK